MHGRKVGILRVRRDGDAGDLQNRAVGRGDVQILRQRIAQGLLADGNLKCRRMRAERAVQLRRLLRDLRRALQGDEQRVRIFCTLVRAALERIGLAEQQAEAVARSERGVVRRGVLRADLIAHPAVLQCQHRLDRPAVVPCLVSVIAGQRTVFVIDRADVRREIIIIVSLRAEQVGIGERGKKADALVAGVERDDRDIAAVNPGVVQKVRKVEAIGRVDDRVVGPVVRAAEEGIGLVVQRQGVIELAPVVGRDLHIAVLLHAVVADPDRQRIRHGPGRLGPEAKGQAQKTRDQEGHLSLHWPSLPGLSVERASSCSASSAESS